LTHMNKLSTRSQPSRFADRTVAARGGLTSAVIPEADHIGKRPVAATKETGENQTAAHPCRGNPVVPGGLVA